MAKPPIPAIAAIDGSTLAIGGPAPMTRGYGSGPSFATWLANKVEQTNQTLVHADQVEKAFATDDSIPVHQVTFAMEQARLSLEIMMQVRTRLVDAYQELSRMQL